MKKLLLSLAATAAMIGVSTMAQAADPLQVCFL